MNKVHNPKAIYTDNQSFNYLSKILVSDCQYPKWFNDSQKEKVSEIKKEEFKNTWQNVINVWGGLVSASNQEDSLKKVVEAILSFVKENETNPESKVLKRMSIVFNEKMSSTLRIKSKDEIMELIKNTKEEIIVPSISEFYKSGLNLDCVEKYLGV